MCNICADHLINYNFMTTSFNESKALIRLSHRRIISLLGFKYADEEPACMVLEYMDNGTLDQYLSSWFE